MANVPVTPPVTPPANPAAPVQIVTPVEATVSTVPDKIQQLLRQIQVNATVAQLPGDGTVTLNSTLGALTLLLPQIGATAQADLTQQLISLLQSQKQLTIVVQPGDPPTQAFLLLPQSTQTSSAITSNIIDTNLALQNLNVQRVSVNPGVSLTAVVLPPDIVVPGNNAAQSPPQTPIAGFPAISVPGLAQAPEDILTQLPNALLQTELATKAEAAVEQTTGQLPQQLPAGTAQPVAPQIANAVPQAPSIPLPQNQSQAAQQILLQLLQAGNSVALRVDAIALPSAPVLIATQPNQIVATVTGTAPGGQLILKAGDATLFLKQAADIPVGSNLLVTISDAKATALTTLADPQSFAGLQQIMSALAQADPQLAQQFIQNIVPQPGPAFSGALLFVLNAFKQGDVRGWLGAGAVDALTKAGKLELITKLSQDLREGGLMARDSIVGEWKSYPIPVNTNNQFQIVNFYVHGDGGRNQNRDFASDKNGAAARHVRFLIDVRMSRLGPMQLDGFVQQKQLDIIVRSEQLLPEGLHGELRAIYTKTLVGIDYAGSLNFQVGRHHWLVVQNKRAAAAIIT